MAKAKVGMFGVVALLVAGVAAAGSKAINFELRETTSLNGTELPPGKYKMAWTGDSAVQVTVSSDGKVVAQASGKFVEREAKALDDAVVSRRNGSGSPVLSEIRFGGKKSALVLSGS